MFSTAKSFSLAALLTGVAALAPVSAEGLPQTMAWTAYDVGSAGYSQAVGIGAALKNKMGVTLRVLPGKNDVSRLVPLRDGKVEFSAFGIGAYQAMEGVDTFGLREWGPQPLYMLSMSNSDACVHLLVAGDIGAKTVADLKGKRIAQVKGAPSLNHNAYTILQFAGLGWDDVQPVEYGGYGASFDGLLENRVDAVFTISTSGNATKVVASPRGGGWLPLPHDDAEGWARMRKASPYYYQHECSEGAGIAEPFEAANYPYPILIAYEDQDADMVYAMTKAMYDLFPDYKDSAPGSTGWGIERQVFEWVMPFHEGAARYYKEVDKWSPEIQANNDRLIARMALLAETWKGYTAEAPAEEAAFGKGWQKARAEALDKAGLDPVFREW